MSGEGRPAVAHLLGAFLADLRTDSIPPAVLDAAKLHALDVMGCGLAAHALGEVAYVHAALREEPAGGRCTVIGETMARPATDAAFVNGTLGHALDFDDTHPTSVVHVSAGVVPAALAAAQACGASGSDIAAAIVAGNEISTRLGNAGSGRYHARGFHPTGVCGVFGAAAAAARVRGLSHVAAAHALGIAGSMASGLLEFLADGTDTKRLHAGWAAQAGVTAARLAAHGATGPATVIEGARGFLSTYLHGETTDIDAELETLGVEWATTAIAFKPYPACHYVHAPVDALAAILREYPLRADDVDFIVGYTDTTGVALVCEPVRDKIVPRTAYDAKFSLNYCLAYRLVHGRLDAASFRDAAIRDTEVHGLSRRIRYELRQRTPGPAGFGGGVRVHTRDGRVFEVELAHQRGGLEDPLSPDDVVEKYRVNATLALTADDADSFAQVMLLLEKQPSAEFLTPLASATPRPPVSPPPPAAAPTGSRSSRTPSGRSRRRR